MATPRQCHHSAADTNIQIFADCQYALSTSHHVSLGHGEGSSRISFDTLNGSLHDSLLISKIVSKKSTNQPIWFKLPIETMA